MAVTRSVPPGPPSENELLLSFNNGDLTALKSAVEKLGFKDEEGLLRFALAVFSKSATRTLTVIDQDGKSIALNPSAALLKENAATGTK